jgi:hypothetical protein
MTATNSIRIEVSANNSVTKPADQYPTGADILADTDLMVYLGVGENVELIQNNLTVDGSTPVRAGDVWSFRTKANDKG